MRTEGFPPARSKDKEVGLEAMLEVGVAQERKCKVKLALCSHVYQQLVFISLVLAFRNL